MICVCQRDGKQKSCGEPQKFLVLDRCGERSTRERKEEGKKKRGKIVSKRKLKVGGVLEGALHCVAVCCGVMKKRRRGKSSLRKTVESRSCAGGCAAVCCSVLQCVAVCCCVLQCVAVCCSVLQCVAVCCGLLQCVAVCCSVCLPYSAVCCSVQCEWL